MKNTLGKGFFLEWLDFVGDFLIQRLLVVPVEKKQAAPRNPTKKQ